MLMRNIETDEYIGFLDLDFIPRKGDEFLIDLKGLKHFQVLKVVFGTRKKNPKNENLSIYKCEDGLNTIVVWGFVFEN